MASGGSNDHFLSTAAIAVWRILGGANRKGGYDTRGVFLDPRGMLDDETDSWFEGLEERCSQLAAFATRPVGGDAAVVWLAEDDVPRCAPLPSSNLVLFREGGGTREAGSTVAESLVVLYRVRIHQIRRRRRTARSSTSQGRPEPLCARIKGVNREVSEGKAGVWPRSFFFLRGPQGAANRQDSCGFFKDAQGFGWLDAGSRAGFTSSRPPPPWTSLFQFSIFLYGVWPCETWTC